MHLSVGSGLFEGLAQRMVWMNRTPESDEYGMHLQEDEAVQVPMMIPINMHCCDRVIMS